MEKRLKYILGILLLMLIGGAKAEASISKKTIELKLGDSIARINLYEKDGGAITFIAPHFNERTGARLAKEIIEREGGRLIEIEALDANGKASRNLQFTLNGKSYSIDPNRIFTENGRNCAGFDSEAGIAIAAFADSLLKLVLSDDGRSLRSGEHFLAAVHNNADIDAKPAEAKPRDLTAEAFLKNHAADSLFHGAFEEQAEGVFLSNTEEDADNFVYVSSPILLGPFAERGFNVVVQKRASRLSSKKCSIDDGSLSIFAARQNIPYINLEADAANGALRQREMIESLYKLYQETSRAGKNALALK